MPGTDLKDIKVNRDFDIPYLAGCNNDDTVVYIDRHLPRTFKENGKSYPVDKYLVVHEIIEAILENSLKVKYQKAHAIAEKAERLAVESDGLSWKTYDAFMQQHIKTTEKEKIQRVPSDLHMKAYEDLKVTSMIKHMKEKMVSLGSKAKERAT